MKGYIYKWTNKINGKIYIGQTYRLKQRLRSYKCLSVKGVSRILRRSMIKHGIENFMFEIIDTASSMDELNKKEAIAIQKANSTDRDIGYNLDTGGTNHIASEETRIRISKAGKGRVPWNKGKKNCYSQETKDKWCEQRTGATPWNKGKDLGPQSDELVEKRIAPLRGIKRGPHSEERKAKISASRTGIKCNSEAYRNKGKTIKANTEFIRQFDAREIEHSEENVLRYTKIMKRRKT